MLPLIPHHKYDFAVIVVIVWVAVMWGVCVALGAA